MKKELLKVEASDYKEEIPLLDNIYIIPTRKKHDSGFMCMQIVGTIGQLGNETYKKTLAYYSDVVQIWKLFKMQDELQMPLSIDIPEYGVIRLFSHECKFKVLYCHLSDFVIDMVRKNE